MQKMKNYNIFTGGFLILIHQLKILKKFQKSIDFYNAL